MAILWVVAPDSRRVLDAEDRTAQLPAEWNRRATLSPELAEVPD